MRGQTYFSYALVAFASSAYAAPTRLVVRMDDALEARDLYVLPGAHSAAKVGTVAAGKSFVQRRQEIEDEEDDEMCEDEDEDMKKRQLDALTGLLGGLGGAGGAAGAAGT